MYMIRSSTVMKQNVVTAIRKQIHFFHTRYLLLWLKEISKIKMWSLVTNVHVTNWDGKFVGISKKSWLRLSNA